MPVLLTAYLRLEGGQSTFFRGFTHSHGDDGAHMHDEHVQPCFVACRPSWRFKLELAQLLCVYDAVGR